MVNRFRYFNLLIFRLTSEVRIMRRRDQLITRIYLLLRPNSRVGISHQIRIRLKFPFLTFLVFVDVYGLLVWEWHCVLFIHSLPDWIQISTCDNIADSMQQSELHVFKFVLTGIILFLGILFYVNTDRWSMCWQDNSILCNQKVFVRAWLSGVHGSRSCHITVYKWCIF